LQIGGHGWSGDQHEDLPGDAPDSGSHGADVQSPVPEAREGGLIAEDEHETHDDGQGGNLGIVVSTWSCGEWREVYDAAWEGEVTADMLVRKYHKGGNNSVDDNGEGDG
jgi:hypothetical protein